MPIKLNNGYPLILFDIDSIDHLYFRISNFKYFFELDEIINLLEKNRILISVEFSIHKEENWFYKDINLDSVMHYTNIKNLSVYLNTIWDQDLTKISKNIFMKSSQKLEKINIIYSLSKISEGEVLLVIHWLFRQDILLLKIC